jgi:peptidoglycan-N-acetylglucosamine deacetylase
MSGGDHGLPTGDASSTALRLRPTKRRRRRWIVGPAALLLLLALGGTTLATAGSGAWPFGRAGEEGAAPPPPSPTATARPTATATPFPTATPAPARPTGGIDLGCGSAPLQPLPGVIRSGPTTTPLVALTFDDGPSPDWTTTILTTLEQTHTPATFFVVGSNVQARPNVLRREAADGFVIGIHTWDHPLMSRLSPSARAWELSATAAMIHKVLGRSYCLPYWRPPFGDYNADVLRQAQALGLTTVNWTVDPQDWSLPGVQLIADRVLNAARPGSIILLHDGYFNRWQTARALPLIIQGLQARGLVPVTLPQLLAGTLPSPPTLTPTVVPTATPPAHYAPFAP